MSWRGPAPYARFISLLEAGAELVDIQALLAHVNLATQIYTDVSEDRIAGRWRGFKKGR